jgi:hypothetical protein
MTTIVAMTSKKSTPAFRRPAGRPRAGFHALLTRQLAKPGADGSRIEPQAGPEPVYLGTITPARPTVSHLLIHDPVYQKACWRIIHDPINMGKNFRDIAPGQAIAIDPKTHEILWGKALAAWQKHTTPIQKSLPSAPPPAPEKVSGTGGISTENPVKNLSTVLEAYVGTPYRHMNCFQLLVQGLKKLGIRYGGSHGLQHRLIQKAEQAKLPENAYLTGEGITDAVSTLVFRNTFYVQNPQQEARRLYAQLAPELAPGMILSFSTMHQGHTGVISRQGTHWTFLNSGIQDHPVGVSTTQKGVGEEDLLAELTNWFQRAKSQKQPLLISIGKLAGDKIASYLPQSTGTGILRASL